MIQHTTNKSSEVMFNQIIWTPQLLFTEDIGIAVLKIIKFKKKYINRSEKQVNACFGCVKKIRLRLNLNMQNLNFSN